MPSGNKSKTKFSRSADLRRPFKKWIRESYRTEIERLFGPKKARIVPRASSSPGGRKSTLAPYVSRRMPIRMTYKGKVYRAVVLKDGRVRYGKKLFTSPTMAAKAATGHVKNGWYWWKYQATRGDWQRLKALRHG
jgi:hypothetical protein